MNQSSEEEWLLGLERAANPPPHCCKIGCEKPPEYAINSSNTPDDYTHSCLEHIPDLMTDATTHYVHKLASQCQCESCQRDGPHASDCAVHYGPALPVGPCDCGKS